MSRCLLMHAQRGDGHSGKEGKKQKDFSFIFGTQSKARAGWPTRLRLVQATP